MLIIIELVKYAMVHLFLSFFLYKEKKSITISDGVTL